MKRTIVVLLSLVLLIAVSGIPLAHSQSGPTPEQEAEAKKEALKYYKEKIRPNLGPVPMGPKSAGRVAGNASDPNDTAANLDISNIAHTDNATSIGYTVTSHDAITANDVDEVVWNIDLDQDGFSDAALTAFCFSILSFDLCFETYESFVDETFVFSLAGNTATTVTASLPRKTICMFAYDYFVTTWDDTDGSGTKNTGETDRAPDTGTITHTLVASPANGTAVKPPPGFAGQRESYLAEGFTAFGYSTFLTVFNPSGCSAALKVGYIFAPGTANVLKTYTVPAQSRFTISVDSEIAPVDGDVSFQVTSDIPVVVERPVYNPAGNGHLGTGVNRRNEDSNDEDALDY